MNLGNIGNLTIGGNANIGENAGATIVIRNPSDKISRNGRNGENSVRQVKRAQQ